MAKATKGGVVVARTRDGIVGELFCLQDEAYGNFQARLMPTVERDRVIGVRMPALRKLAKSLSRECSTKAFLRELPHHYFEENQLHALILNDETDFECCLVEVERFLPHIDNWATCDALSPKAFSREAERLLPYIDSWIDTGEAYTQRFALGLLMRHFLDERFDPVQFRRVADLRSEEYYVRMMVAWYFATALAKQWEAALPYVEAHRLPDWVHNKTIQKACESFRVSDEHKARLRSLRLGRKGRNGS